MTMQFVQISPNRAFNPASIVTVQFGRMAVATEALLSPNPHAPKVPYVDICFNRATDERWRLTGKDAEAFRRWWDNTANKILP